MALISAQPLKALPSADLGNASTIKVFQTSAAAAIVLPVAGASHFKNRRFEVRAWGRVEGGTTTNFTVTLQWGTSATSASNTTVKASSALAVNSEKANWELSGVFVLDGDSLKLQGRVGFRVNDATADAAAVTTEITAVDPTVDTALQGFVVNGTFSASNSGNHAYLDGFELEV